MPSIVLAWLTGWGIIGYRSYKQDGRLPVPGQLLAASGIFVMLGVLDQAPGAGFLASALAWGFDTAAFLNIAPELLTGGTNTSTKPGLSKGPQDKGAAPTQTGA